MGDVFRNYEIKRVPYAHGTHKFNLAIGHGLFSSGQVDLGTTLLLRSLRGKPVGRHDGDEPRAILDVGCGYGPLAIALAAEHPNARVVGFDRDLLAVRFAHYNAQQNARSNVTVLPSIGYGTLRTASAADGLPADYDLIVANLPAKVGESGLHVLLLGAGKLLAPGGRVAVVVVTPIAKLLAPMIEDASAVMPVVVEHQDSRTEYTIWHLRFPEGLPDLQPRRLGEAPIADDPLAPFLRDDAPLEVDGAAFTAVANVPEFDTLDHRGKTILSVLNQTHRPPTGGGERILNVNPRHGMLANRLIAERHPRELALIDRDLLALTAAERNVRAYVSATRASATLTVRLGLALGAVDAVDPAAVTAPVAGPFDLIAGVIHEEEGRPGLRQWLREAAQLLSPEGVIVLGLRAAEIQTLLKPAADGVGFRFGRSLKRKGFAAQLLRPAR